MRGFEITVQKSQPHALMSSYNLLNWLHTSEHRGLLEDILRAEFGFKGIIMTDWVIGAMTGKNRKYPGPVSPKMAVAGNDLMMPGGPGDYKNLLKGLKNGTVTREQLQINASRVIRMIRKLVQKQ